MMWGERWLPAALFMSVLLTLMPVNAIGQVRELRQQLPTFQTTEDEHRAELHVFFPSVNVMAKLESRAASDVFTPEEFGYLVGEFHSVIASVLAESLYPQEDARTLASVRDQLEAEAKPMRRPFQKPDVVFGMALDRKGLQLEVSGQSAERGEYSFTTEWTWAQILARQ